MQLNNKRFLNLFEKEINEATKTLYLDYIDHNMTLEYFALYHEIGLNEALKIIIKGRELCG